MTGVKPRNRRTGSGSGDGDGFDPGSRRSKGRAGDVPGNNAPAADAAGQKSIFASIYSLLPPVLRELLPFGPDIIAEAAAAPPDGRSDLPSWQDVCFIHAI